MQPRWLATVCVLVLVVAVSACNSESYAMELSEGDCFDDPPATAGGVREVPAVDCDEPHDNEVYAVLEMPEGPYPGVNTINSFADTECADAFADYVGIDYMASELFAFYFPPNEASWDAGHRTVICYLFDEDGPLEGTAAGSQR